MKKQLTCIVCPMGCEITVELGENNEIIKISGVKGISTFASI